MTFSNAVAGISESSESRNATKIPQWAGYVYKSSTGLTEEEISNGKFRLVFVKSNGDQFVYKWDGVADYDYEGVLTHSGSNTLALLTETPTASTKLVVDADLLEALTYDTWDIGAQAQYDSRRVGPGEWM